MDQGLEVFDHVGQHGAYCRSWIRKTFFPFHTAQRAGLPVAFLTEAEETTEELWPMITALQIARDYPIDQHPFTSC